MSTAERVISIAESRRRAWKSLPAFIEYRDMTPERRAHVEALSAAFRASTAELVEALVAHGEPVPLEDGTTVRLNLDGDGPFFLAPPSSSLRRWAPEYYRKVIEDLDAKDAERFGKAVAS